MKSVDELIAIAREAQRKVDNYTQEQINEVCLAIGWEVYNDENIVQLAELAVEETGYGRVQDKIAKHKNKILGVLRDTQDPKAVSAGLIERDEAKGISKYAKPAGVVACITPATNPTATPSSNAVTILKGRNAVIFRASSRAKKATKLAIDFMRQGLEKVGAPVDLIQIMEEPTRETTAELLQKADLIVATGGGAMVRACYSSGTPSHGVGPGNAVAIIAEDADVADAIEKVSLSKVFDYATSCSSENSIIVHESVYDQALEELRKNDGYICNAEERDTLEKWLWVPNKKGKIAINPKIVAQSVDVIAAAAGLSIPEGTEMLVVTGDADIENDRYAEEKLSPVLTIYKYKTWEEAKEILRRNTANFGSGHSNGIHTFNKEYIEDLGMTSKTSRILVNQPMAPANGGNFYNGMPSTPTLGAGSWGETSTTENINYRHFINVTWLSVPIPESKPTDEEMFGKLWAKIG